jgi:hypothetical protein
VYFEIYRWRSGFMPGNMRDKYLRKSIIEYIEKEGLHAPGVGERNIYVSYCRIY